jgi:protein gp37
VRAGHYLTNEQFWREPAPPAGSPWDATALSAVGKKSRAVDIKRGARLAATARDPRWSPNVWQGVSVESARYTSRIAHLQEVPAAVRFLSAEPLLGPIPRLPLIGIHWVIVGGESGGGRRPVDPAWVRDIRDRCVAARIPFFFKQWGGRTPKAGGRVLDGRTWDELPSPGLRSGAGSRKLNLGTADPVLIDLPSAPHGWQ